MNYLDIGIIVFIAFCALIGYKRGLIRAVYGLVSFFVAMLLANSLYPHVASFLQRTPLYGIIQNQLKDSLNLGEIVIDHTANHQEEILNVINELPLPEQFRARLNENFEPDLYEILRVDTIENHISGFFANIAINGIAMILVFIIVMIILVVVGRMLDIVGKFPAIRTFNNWGGLIFGTLLGLGISWLIIVTMSMFYAASAEPEIYGLLNSSFIVRRFFDSIIVQLA